jgi:hypothetical protein
MKAAAASTSSQVQNLDELVGAHPQALRAIYEAGHVPVLSSFGARLRGRLLGVKAPLEVFLGLRAFVRFFATDKLPWQGKTFSADGNAGHNVVFGREVAPFRVELASSALDGAPTIALRYDEPADRNPLPLRVVRDEMREVAPGVLMGPILKSDQVIGWWGLERRD